jgi:Ankyrin repeats (3 copies)/Ankyrin repeat
MAVSRGKLNMSDTSDDSDGEKDGGNDPFSESFFATNPSYFEGGKDPFAEDSGTFVGHGLNSFSVGDERDTGVRKLDLNDLNDFDLGDELDLSDFKGIDLSGLDDLDQLAASFGGESKKGNDGGGAAETGGGKEDDLVAEMGLDSDFGLSELNELQAESVQRELAAKEQQESAADKAIGQLADTLAGLSTIIEQATGTIREKAEERRRLVAKRELESQEVRVEDFSRIVRLAAGTGDVEALRQLSETANAPPLATLRLADIEEGTGGEDGENGGETQVACDTVLHVASAFGHAGVVAMLLDELKMDPEHPVEGGSFATPLDLAAAAGATDVVRLLLEHGAAVDGSDPGTGTGIEEGGFYSSPLHRAASAGARETVSVLLEKGANALALDENGMFPWMCAANPATLEALVAATCPELKEGIQMRLFWSARALWDPLRPFGGGTEGDAERLAFANHLIASDASALRRTAAALAAPVSPEWLDQMYGVAQEGSFRAGTFLGLAVNAVNADWVALLLFHGVDAAEVEAGAAQAAYEDLWASLEDTPEQRTELLRAWRAISVMLRIGSSQTY